MYVLYRAATDELLWTWAHNERKRIEGERSGWKDQESVTVRFSRILDGAALAEIRSVVEGSFELQNHVREILSSASNIEKPLTLSIDPYSRETIDGKGAAEILRTSGRLLVTGGYLEEFKRLVKLLDAEAEKDPTILLSRAYAEHTLGNYQIARGLIAQAALRLSELDDDNKQFWEFLKMTLDWLTGDRTIEEYSTYLQGFDDRLTGNFGTSYLLNKIRFRIITTKDPYGRADDIKELKRVVGATIRADGVSLPLKLFAKSVWLEVEGTDIALSLLRDVAGDSIRVDQGFPSQLDRITKDLETRHLKFIVDLETTMSEVKELGHRPLRASLTQISAFISFVFLSNTYSISRILRADTNDPEFLVNQRAIFEKGIRLTNESIELYREIGDTEGEVRAKAVQAEYFDFVGERENAVKIATEMLPVAEMFGFARQIEVFKDILADDGLRKRLDSSSHDRSPIEIDVRRLHMSDEQLLLYASQFRKTMDIPEDRAEFVDRAYLGVKMIAKERLDWCRHLDVLENESHKRSPELFFRTEPDRTVTCKKRGLRSTFPNPDLDMVIKAFKSANCQDCPDRSPVSDEERQPFQIPD